MKQQIKNVFIATLGLGLGLVASCRDGDEASELKITNGIKRQPDALKAVISQDGCTGTFVSPNTIITAAHCADKGFTYKGVKTKSWKSMGDHYDLKWTFDIDVRVLVFPKNVSDVWIPVSDRPLEKDDKILIAGYGIYDKINKKHDGKFRFGTNKVNSFLSDGQVSLIDGVHEATIDGKEGLDSVTGPGDSGGPMLRDGQLVGVLSGSQGKTTLHVNLTHPKIRAFLDEMLKEGAKINFGGKSSIAYEECFDVDGAKDLSTLNFKQPHSKISSISGEWKTCVRDSCPTTSAAGYSSGVYKDYRPVYSNVNAGAMLVWGKKNGDDSDKTFEKAGAVKGASFEFPAGMVFGANLSMHAKPGAKKSGKLKVCFL